MASGNIAKAAVATVGIRHRCDTVKLQLPDGAIAHRTQIRPLPPTLASSGPFDGMCSAPAPIEFAYTYADPIDAEETEMGPLDEDVLYRPHSLVTKSFTRR
jgi:hypothetical protein